jgi:hypothetical protein
LIDVDGHALVHRVFVDGGSVDHAGDGDELFAGGIGAGADPGDQQRAAEQLTPRAARAARDETLDEKYRQHGHQQDQQSEFPHGAMVGP